MLVSSFVVPPLTSPPKLASSDHLSNSVSPICVDSRHRGHGGRALLLVPLLDPKCRAIMPLSAKIAT